MKKFYLAILSILFFAATGFAQVQLIPASDGGFENATPTLAANGWTSVDDATNFWRVGTVTHSPTLGGTQAAYISTSATGLNNGYNGTASRTSHFYRDITVPAGATSITLTFEWRGNIELPDHDRFLVYTADPLLVTPVAGAPLSNSTAMGTAVLVFTQTVQSGPPYTATTPYIQFTSILPNSLAGTNVRLIFTWQNNSNTSALPPAAIDNVSLTYIPPIPPTITSFSPASACLGNTITITGTDFTGATAVQFNGVNAASYIVVNNTTITAVLPASGVTTGPITVTTTNGTGTSATDLTINPPAPTALTYTLTTASYCVGTAIANNNPSNGGGTPTSYSVSPALPAGLSIDPVTGIISGTPTAVTASATYTVTASNSCGNTTVGLTIDVSTAPVTVTYATNPATYCAGIAIAPNSPTTTSGGAPTGYTVSPALPAGLTLNAGTGVISGTPTTTAGVATATYTVTATNICGSTTVDVVITISPAAPTALTYTLTTASYCVGTAIANNNPSNGGGTPASYSVSPALPAG
ncbi:MAG TPA: putative Ig domain-containing protein, partial [Ginsengibacter sp.]